MSKTSVADIVGVGLAAAARMAGSVPDDRDGCHGWRPKAQDREPDGYIETADPATGEIEMMAYWLPDFAGASGARSAPALSGASGTRSAPPHDGDGE